MSLILRSALLFSKGALRRNPQKLLKQLRALNMTQEQKERVRIIQGHFADIDKRISQIDEIIGRLTAEYEGTISSYVQFPESIVVSQLQSFRKSVPICLEFGSSRRLCSWAGLVPGNNQSAGKRNL